MRCTSSTQSGFEMKKGSKSRVNMRLPEDIVYWAKKYAKERDRSFTSVIEEFLREAMEGDQHREAIARRVLRNRSLHASDI